MDWGPLASVAVAVVGVGGVMIERRRREPRGRDRIKTDLELLSLLPTDSELVPEFRAHIEDSIRQIIKGEDEKRRDPFGIALASVFILIAVALVTASVLNGGWYWWLTVPGAVTGIFGIAGLAQDATKRTRDERGRPMVE
ncbi:MULTISPECIES: hypothetical protein [Streptomyces althioticus group]|uniref:hypothetical protein n=1 Tax=Streptomyces althioticus group TaxID=2867194 RepID=UPI00131A19B3|nr:hypothetical protein [Streptomyces griseorubens]